MQPAPGNDPPGISRFTAVTLAVATFIAYVTTIPGSVTGGDSGELICAASDLGVAHPPGYPLWTMLANLFTHIPFGSLAWRVNLFSAVCAAVAAGLICRATQLWTGRWWTGIFAGGIFAFSPLTWTWAVQAEVFALNNLLLSALLCIAVKFANDAKLRHLNSAAFVAGLAMANQHTSIFVIVPLAVWFLVRIVQQRLFTFRCAAQAAGFTALGLLPYAYLPLAARFSHGLVWGEPDTFEGFVAHLLRREYGTFLPAAGMPASKVVLSVLLGRYFSSVTMRLLIIGLPLAILGACAALAESKPVSRRTLVITIVLVLAGYLVGFQSLLSLSPEDPLLAGVLARFWLLPDLILAMLAGIGLAAIVRQLPRLHPLCVVLVPVIVLVQCGLHWQGQRQYSSAVADFGRAILANLPEQTILLLRGDLPSNAVRYVQQADHERPDVITLDQELLTRRWYVRQMAHKHPNVRFPGVQYDPAAADGFTLATLVQANQARHPVWLYPEPKPGDPSQNQLALWPEGLPQCVFYAGEQPPDLLAWEHRDVIILETLGKRFAPLWNRFPPGTWEHVVAEDYWSAVHRHAFMLLQLALATPSDSAALNRARSAYEAFVAQAPGTTWFAWKNLGMIYERLALNDPSFRPRIAAAWARYLELAPPDDPDRAAVANAISHNTSGEVK